MDDVDVRLSLTGRLNRSSEASKAGGAGTVEPEEEGPQSLLRGIERRFYFSGVGQARDASIAPQRHRKLKMA